MTKSRPICDLKKRKTFQILQICPKTSPPNKAQEGPTVQPRVTTKRASPQLHTDVLHDPRNALEQPQQPPEQKPQDPLQAEEAPKTSAPDRVQSGLTVQPRVTSKRASPQLHTDVSHDPRNAQEQVQEEQEQQDPLQAEEAQKHQLTSSNSLTKVRVKVSHGKGKS